MEQGGCYFGGNNRGLLPEVELEKTVDRVVQKP
jgi:hypothetical protein